MISLSWAGFTKYLAIYTGLSLRIRVSIPYLYSFEDVYEPVTFILTCSAIFWILCGITSGILSRNTGETVFSSLLQFITVVLAASASFTPLLVIYILLLVFSSWTVSHHRAYVLKKHE